MMERTRSVRIEFDGIVGLGELEDAALAFGRSAPAQLVAGAIESMVADLLDVVVGPFGLPLATGDQFEALFACTRCASRRGFRRRGFRPKLRKVMTACGRWRSGPRSSSVWRAVRASPPPRSCWA